MEFTLKFDESAINLILNGLAELPYKQSAGLIQGIQNEARKQSQPQLAQEPASDVAPAADDSEAPKTSADPVAE